MACIDRADWHYAGPFPRDLPPECGATHIGMYLSWLILGGLISQPGLRLLGPRLTEFRKRSVTGRELLLRELDEKLFDRLLTARGRAFTKSYYTTDVYFADYEACLGADVPSIYCVHDSWDNFDRLAPLISSRYNRWRTGERWAGPTPSAAEEEARERYLRVVSEAGRLLREFPEDAIAVMERYCSEESSSAFTARALRDLAALRRRPPL